MPEIQRLPIRFECNGLDLVSAPDRCPPGSFLRLTNARVLDEGRVDGRPGNSPYGNTAPAPKLLHSIRRLNDPDTSFAAAGYTYIVGNGTTLDAGIETALAQIDTGYSGNPLSLIPFRPDVAPESWMYVYDSAKQSKVRPDGALRAIGVVPPNAAPQIEYGQPAEAVVSTGQSAAGWGFAGATTAVALTDRQAAAANAITYILYNSGTTGWCCFFVISGSSGDYSWAGERMNVILNPGGGNQETVTIREIHQNIANTTVAGIQYDIGATGPCSVVLTNNPGGLDRNSLISIGGEIVRVQAVVLSPDGTVYSIRVSTAGTFAAGAAVVGLTSWYAYTVNTHVIGEPIGTSFLKATQAAAGTGAIAVKVTENCRQTNLGRPIDPANDYLHISLFLQNPQNIAELDLLVDVNPGTATGTTAFSVDWLQWTLSQDKLGKFGTSSASVWVELLLPISSATRNGGNLNFGIAGVYAVGVSLTTTGACDYGFDWWYLFGTYGPVIQPNAPTGYDYVSRNRDSTTGAASVPSPITFYQLNPLRESVIITPAASVQTGVDYLDIYRKGGTLTEFLYIGSVRNNASAFTDGLADATILASNPSTVDLTLLQPWLVLDQPWSGTVNVVGTSVRWASGTLFNMALVANSLILLNGVAYQTHGSPHSTTWLELNTDAGVLTGAAYSIQSPTIAGQTLPLAFGPLEGPFSPVVFALGDTKNSGTLYFSNTSDLDAASDQNTLDLCGPTEPLVTGEVWNGLVFAGSRENIWLVRYSFQQATGGSPFQFNRLPSPSGFWSRWAICRGPDGIYALGRDGIYRFTEGGGISITDDKLYPLFPHDGQAATGANGYLPVDMTQINFMRLSAQDQEIRFTYLDTGGTQQTLRYEITRKRWFHHNYADPVAYEYLNEPLVNSPNTLQILQLSRTLGLIYLVGGNTDNGTAVGTVAQLPYFDGGDERAQRLHVDYMVDIDQTGTVATQEFYNNGTASLAASNVVVSGPRIQSLVNASSVPAQLNLYRNVSMLMTWTGGPAGPRIYAFEPSFYLMPYLSLRVTTQVTEMSFPGWKLWRRLYPGIISTVPVSFLIYCQDGRSFTVTIPSTGGRFRIVPQMLPQNIKDLAFGLELDGGGSEFALFPESFTAEVKDWVEDTFIRLAVFKA